MVDVCGVGTLAVTRGGGWVGSGSDADPFDQNLPYHPRCRISKPSLITALSWTTKGLPLAAPLMSVGSCYHMDKP